MARLSARERAMLPDSAFAYVDSTGGRRLPIHDEAHVRAALSRFDRVAFEDDVARERARTRLLRAAKRHGIVPVGFITGQLRSERSARTVDRARLPTGSVTFLLTDIEGSTDLVQRLGDGYSGLLDGVRDIIRGAVIGQGGHEVDARADEFFAVFRQAPRAVQAAVEIQHRLGGRSWPGGSVVRVRAGIHSGRPKLTRAGYVGISVHTAARVCSAADGGQILVSGQTASSLEGSLAGGLGLRHLGRHRLPGLTHPEDLYQVVVER